MEKISEFTIRRLSNYYRILLDLQAKEADTVSSARLAKLCGVTSAQVRKDLSYFGNFGTRGLGYSVAELKGAIEKILGLDRNWTVALFGAGFLGHALFFYQGFTEDGFYFKHIFDVDPQKLGTRWGDIEIQSIEKAKEALSSKPVDIGVIATPPSAAQGVADLCIECGVGGVLNFAPVRLKVPERFGLRNVNLAVALESLSFFLSR